MRRLTVREFSETVRSLLGAPAGMPATADVPNEGRIDGFENNVASQSLDERHVNGFLGYVETLTTALLADASRRDKVIGCRPTGSERESCTRAFIKRFGRQAFRRPLSDDESRRFLALAAATDADAARSPYAGVERIVHAMLGSPLFLFVIETGTPDPEQPGRVRLTGHELATRLALALTGAGPSEALLDAAEAGTLNTPDGLARAARELLSAPRAGAARLQFAAAWLRLDGFDGVEVDRKLYPQWSDGLRGSMREETERFLRALLDDPRADLRDVVRSDSSFLDERLAGLYALPPPARRWDRTRVAEAGRGAGLLTQGTFLTMTAPHRGVEPIKRGQFVRDVLLCERLPSPPGDVPGIEQAQVPPNASDRERLAAHRDNPACSGCHEFLDPIGFAFSQFDGIGARRLTDASGKAIDVRGKLVGAADPDFEGPLGLADKLHDAPSLAACISTQMFRHAFSRTEGDDDACTLSQIQEGFGAGGHSFAALVDGLVRSPAFRTRRLPAATAPEGSR
jgi:hypothetical protein